MLIPENIVSVVCCSKLNNTKKQADHRPHVFVAHMHKEKNAALFYAHLPSQSDFTTFNTSVV